MKILMYENSDSQRSSRIILKSPNSELVEDRHQVAKIPGSPNIENQAKEKSMRKHVIIRIAK